MVEDAIVTRRSESVFTIMKNPESETQIINCPTRSRCRWIRSACSRTYNFFIKLKSKSVCACEGRRRGDGGRGRKCVCARARARVCVCGRVLV